MAKTKIFPPAQFERWKKIRAKGRPKFVIIYGMLAWGPVTGVIFHFARVFISGVPNTVENLLFAIAMFVIIGSVFGFSLWRISEKRYLATVAFLASDGDADPGPDQRKASAAQPGKGRADPGDDSTHA